MAWFYVNLYFYISMYDFIIYHKVVLPLSLHVASCTAYMIISYGQVRGWHAGDFIDMSVGKLVLSFAALLL